MDILDGGGKKNAPEANLVLRPQSLVNNYIFGCGSRNIGV